MLVIKNVKLKINKNEKIRFMYDNWRPCLELTGV